MGQGYILRNGGTGLRFKVVQYSSASFLPKVAQENTIAVITGENISEYVAYAGPVSAGYGRVHIGLQTGGSYEIALTKKNPIWIGLKDCKQYDGSKWVYREAWVYTAGSWKRFSRTIAPYLYKSGVSDYANTALTGGWHGTTFRPFPENAGDVNVLTINSSYLQSEQTTKIYNGDGHELIYTGRPIPFDGYSKIRFHVTSLVLTAPVQGDEPWGAQATCSIGFGSNATDYGLTRSVSVKSTGTYDVDISGYSNGFVKILTYMGNSKKQRAMVRFDSITLIE